MSTPFFPANDGPAGARKRAETLFYETLDLPPGDREAFLHEACGPDASLRAEVEGYLHHYEQAGSFLKEDSSVSPELEAEFARLKPEEVGERIGPYKLLEQIGEGGFGTVWVAEQEKPIRRRVALKIIKLGMDTKEVIARFEQERQALAMMDHPNVAKVLDAGATQYGRPFFVMELVRGLEITDYCDDKQLSTQERIELFITVCQAVQHAHQKGIIHRDLKPSNILVTINDGKAVPKVIDFGVAKATQGRLVEQTVYTQFQQMIGTPLYMSPEQAELTSLDIDTRSDIYSLGVLLYELLTGHTPIDQDTLARVGMDEIRRLIREVDPPRPSLRMKTLAAAEMTTAAKRRNIEPAKLSGALCGDIDWIVMKCIEKDRARRYDTANSLARDLERHLRNEVIAARPPTAGYLLSKLIRRHKLVFIAGAAIAVSLIIGLGVSIWMYSQAVAARNAQEQERKKAEGEAGKSRQVAQLLQDMLEGVGPSVALGRDTTMLREILDKTSERAGKDLIDQSAVEAELRITLGSVYYQLGRFRDAEEAYRKALRLHRAAIGSADSKSAAMIVGLVHAILEQGRLAEAESLAREALGVQERLAGGETLELANALETLGAVLFDEHRDSDAEKLYFDALAIKRKLLDHQSLAMSATLQGFAAVMIDRGKWGEAERTATEALAILRQLQAHQSPEEATILDNLGQAFWRERKLPEAEAAHREALTIRQKILGDQHLLTQVSYSHLVNVLLVQGKRDEAQRLIEDGLARSPRSAFWLKTRGNLFGREGRWREAIEDLTAAIQLDADDVWSWFQLAPLLLEAGEIKMYQRHRQAMLMRFGSSDNITVMRRTARVCLLSPPVEVDSLAEIRLTDAATAADRHWGAFTKALLEYRSGHFNEAVQWVNVTLASPTHVLERDPQAYALLALAHHRLNHGAEAANALAKAIQLTNANLPSLADGDLGVGWNNWIIVQFLIREARELIEGKP